MRGAADGCRTEVVAVYDPVKYRAKAKNLCACGCGGLALRKFVNGHNTRLMSSEEQSRRGNLNTGAHFLNTGAGKWYRKVDQRHEHRTVMEKRLGRNLSFNEVVHHKDNDKRNNDPDNLELMTRSEHSRHHALERQRG